MTDSSYDEKKEDVGPVLKTDVLGRVKTGALEREAMLDEFERSSLHTLLRMHKFTELKCSFAQVIIADSRMESILSSLTAKKGFL